jgi:hypothetical protein
MINVLVACEQTGTVRDAFLAEGHNAWSCDIAPNPSPLHIRKDVREVMTEENCWDLIIAHPPCTYLTVAANRYMKMDPGCYVKKGILIGRERLQAQKEALEFVQFFLDYPYCEHIAVENPVGAIGTKIRPASQYIQPYNFGHDVSKKTGLWLKGLPDLKPTGYVEPRLVGVYKRWGNQTDSGNIKRGDKPTRSIENATTYEGVAKAMAKQWGDYVQSIKDKK